MELRLFNLGLIDYEKAYQFQKNIFQDIKADRFRAALILCRHYPVITLGRQASPENIRIPLSELENINVHSYRIERGGDVTYHGPGQIIAYPLFDLNYFKKDVHLFLRKLEETAINFLSDLAIKAVRRKGLTGAWVGEKKIASIGIAIRNWITFHGMSINIKGNDLNNFRLIKPCGMDIEMTSVETLLDKSVEAENLQGALIRWFKEVFRIAG